MVVNIWHWQFAGRAYGKCDEDCLVDLESIEGWPFAKYNDCSQFQPQLFLCFKIFLTFIEGLQGWIQGFFLLGGVGLINLTEISGLGFCDVDRFNANSVKLIDDT